MKAQEEIAKLWNTDKQQEIISQQQDLIQKLTEQLDAKAFKDEHNQGQLLTQFSAIFKSIAK